MQSNLFEHLADSIFVCRCYNEAADGINFEIYQERYVGLVTLSLFSRRSKLLTNKTNKMVCENIHQAADD